MQAATYYKMPCEVVQTLPTGEIDYSALAQRLAANRGRPAILNVNIGTTVKVSGGLRADPKPMTNFPWAHARVLVYHSPMLLTMKLASCVLLLRRRLTCAHVP